jgi:hypothetical protein
MIKTMTPLEVGGEDSIPHYATIEAPSILLLFTKRVEALPDALLAEGLDERLNAQSFNLVEPLQYDGRRDPETKLLKGG